VSIALAPASSAGAQPVVRVRAETRIELRAERRPARVAIVGTLRDDLGSALPDRAVDLRAIPADPAFATARVIVRTSTDGSFEGELALPTGAYTLRALFEGDDDQERVEVERPLDLDHAEVRLEVVVPSGGRIDLDRAGVDVEVTARSTEGGAGIGIELVDELDRPLGSARTDARGLARLHVPARALGGPGAGRLVVRSHADARRAQAQTEVPVVRYRATRVSLSASVRQGTPGDAVVLRGRLSDSAGPLDRKAIGIFVAGAHHATVLSRSDGTFSVPTELDDGQAGRWVVQARFDSDAPWRGSSRSAELTIDVSSTNSAPWLALGVCSLLSLLLLWLIARRSPRRAAPERAVSIVPQPPGVVAARRRRLGADRFDLSGVVLDVRGDEPIPSAEVTLETAAGPLRVPVDALGAFGLAAVPGGSATLEVIAPGYGAVRASFAFPHRGECSDLVVRLESLRGRALAALLPIAQAIAPGRRGVGVWTPRELVRRAGRAQAAALEQLAADVERAGWGREPPTADGVARIEREAGELAGKLGPPDPPTRVDESEPGSL